MKPWLAGQLDAPARYRVYHVAAACKKEIEIAYISPRSAYTLTSDSQPGCCWNSAACTAQTPALSPVACAACRATGSFRLIKVTAVMGADQVHVICVSLHCKEARMPCEQQQCTHVSRSHKVRVPRIHIPPNPFRHSCPIRS